MTILDICKNYNNKLGCEVMCHIMRPAKRITSESFDKEVLFKAGEMEKAYKLHDYVAMPVKEVPGHLYQSAFGMVTKQEFYGILMELYDVQPSGDCGVYFFILSE